MPLKGTSITRPCARCGKLVTRLVSQTTSERLFCGRACTKNRVTVACKTCGTTFETRAGRKQASYCSSACKDRRAVPAEGRFWRYVDKNGPVPEHAPELGPCWLWTGNIVAGYGTLGTWSDNNVRGTIKAHRLSLSMKLGRPLTDDEKALHHCDARSCVNPEHLYAGTTLDNAADAIERDRYLRGERSPRARLTNAQAEEIRSLYTDGARQVDIAAQFGVHQTVISRIVRGIGY